METFTDVYKKSREVVTDQKFEPTWNTFLSKDVSLKGFLAINGLSSKQVNLPEKVRVKITHEKQTGNDKKRNAGDVIFAAAQNPASKGTWTDRAATLKMVRHLHHAHKRGGQDVWVYSPPKGHTTWIFDEMVGGDATIRQKLAMEAEIFSSKEMKHMATSLGVALKVAEDTKHKLAGKDKNMIAVVKRWFLDETSTDADCTSAIAALRAGFKKIAIACNSSRLVFTDYPNWRATRDKYYGAAFRGGEGGGFPVVYLEGAFTRLTGNSGKLWLCAETIIHELSHHQASTQDHAYDSDGLKPASATFPYAKAIDNADSWGYFAIDLAGYLSKADRTRVLV